MEKFEVGKIYAYKRGSGCGYDECISYDYYLITRKTEKSIWWKKISVAVEVYGKVVDEKADFKKFDVTVTKADDRKALEINMTVTEVEEEE